MSSISSPTVLHLIHTGGAGGAETVVIQLVDALAERGWRSVAAVPGGSWLESALGDSPACVMPIPDTRKFDVPLIRMLRAAVREHEVSVMHSHLFGPAVYASLLKAVGGPPVVSTIHGAVDLTVAYKWGGLKKRLLTWADARVVAVTEELRTVVVSELGIRPDRARTIPNGIDVDRFAPGPADGLRAEMGWTGNHIVIGAVGNVRRPKDYGTLLEAAARLRRRRPECRVAIVGDMEGEPGLTAELMDHRAALDLDGTVAFTGFRDDIPGTLNAFDIYVMSSSREGLPLSLLQAMATRLPVVATRCGGPDELLSDGRDGVLVPVSDPDALAGALDRIAGDRAERERLADAARATVEERHTLDRMAGHYEALYKECLGQGPVESETP